MIRLRYILSIAAYLSSNLTAAQGSHNAVQHDRRVDSLYGTAHETSHQRPTNYLYGSLRVARGLVEAQDQTVEVATDDLYDILNQIKSLQNKVIALLPSGSEYSLCTSSKTQTQSQSSGITTEATASASSDSVNGGAFVEDDTDDETQSSSEDSDDLDDESSTEQSLDSAAISTDYSSSTRGSAAENTQEAVAGSSAVPGSTSGPAPEETGTSSGDESSEAQGSDTSDSLSSNGSEGEVSNTNSFSEESNLATSTGLVTTVRQGPSTPSTIYTLDWATNKTRTSVSVNGKTIYWDTPEPNPRTTSSVVSVKAGLIAEESADSLNSQDDQELTTIVFTSTNTKEATTTMTTTLTKFLPLPQTRSSGIFFELGVSNMTTTPGALSAGTNTAGTPAVSPETPALTASVIRVPGRNTTADGSTRTGFRTLSKRTASAGEQEKEA